MPNRLIHETSPYLLQHANNPVDWYAWGPDALEKAKREDKPILLSVGYSACHWCHVMEHESFENDEIAQLMNANFVCIKVDREERPDIDQIYQNVAQLMTRSGGWPLTVFLTPEMKPFYGGTYFPPADRYGRPGFPRVLASLAHAYKNNAPDILENAAKMVSAIEKLENAQPMSTNKKTNELLAHTAEELLSYVDWQNGGFGDAPKFPNTMALTFLWRTHLVSSNPKARHAVEATLDKMARGGIYDQLGGGFHRYSVDSQWLVPHFEKMLYDNALLLKLYSEVVLTSERPHPLFLKVIEQTTEYILREMRSPAGNFFSTQDADSPAHEGERKEEGMYFVWKPSDLEEFLNPDEAKEFAQHFGVTHEGNFEDGLTVLQLNPNASGNEKDLSTALKSAIKKAGLHRAKRIEPDRDEKTLVSWNGLMITGLCHASKALKNDNAELAALALNAAEDAFAFIEKKMSRENRLWSTYKDGTAKVNAFLDDYAYLATAALDLARFHPNSEKTQSWLQSARMWTEVILDQFSDEANGGFFFTSKDHETLIQRPKTIFDQAIPSGAAIMLQNLIVLAELCAEPKFYQLAQDNINKLEAYLEQSPLGMGELANALQLFLLGPSILSSKSEADFHPYIFRKLGEGSGEDLICHMQTCFPLNTTLKEYAKITYLLARLDK